MKALIIGYGSIGKRHEEVLRQIHLIETIHLVTRQSLDHTQTYSCLEDIDDLNQYHYFIIASTTKDHLHHLSYLENQVRGKIILCEKPLFDTYSPLSILNNHVFVGYVLRYHPVMQELKNRLSTIKIFAIHIHAGSFLPLWRPGQDYTKCYSADKNAGGGVLLDLSHELDYLQWLTGSITQLHSFQGKFSPLEITSDDTAMIMGQTASNIAFNCTLNYYSSIPVREIYLHTYESTILADLGNNSIKECFHDGRCQEKSFEFTRNEAFLAMHYDILSAQSISCTYEEGLTTMKIIETIQKGNQ